MNMKYFLSSILSLTISLSAIAQSNPGVDYLVLGEKELAKTYFMRTMRQTPAESHYYLGQIALEAGNLAEAKTSFESGLAANPESALNAVGLAKLNFKTDPKGAEKELGSIQRQNKKDVTVLLEIARAYYENGLPDKGEKVIADARKADKKSAMTYIIEGLMHEKNGKVNEAATQYDQAINLDPANALGYIKGAQVYQHINPVVAKEMLNKVIDMQPSNKAAYKFLANLNYTTRFYDDAINAYKKYMDGDDYSALTMDDYRDLGAAQFFTDKFADAKITLGKGLEKEPQNFVLNRLMMYTQNDLKEFDEAESIAKTFFAIPRDTAKYIAQDYMTYGNILSELGNKNISIEQYEKAIALDSTHVAIYKEIASTCASENMLEEAGNYMDKYIKKQGETLEPNDIFSGANYYYRAGDAARKDSLAEKSLDLLNKADAGFSHLTEVLPEVPLGYLMRARVNAAKDPETEAGVAKPYYEKLLEVVKAEADKSGEPLKRTTEMIEAYTYLSYYYYLQYVGKEVKSAKALGLEYVGKLLELDPSNNTGAQLKPAFE